MGPWFATRPRAGRTTVRDMPKKVTWGICLIVLLPVEYVLLHVNRGLVSSRYHLLGQILEGLIWLPIAAGWLGGPVLIAWGLLRDLPRRSAQQVVLEAPRHGPSEQESSEVLRRRLDELRRLHGAGTITTVEHDNLRQQALNSYARES